MRARERAEGCFALARSTTFAPEREAAIARGKAIAQAAGLPIELFDIPGEERRPAASRFAEDLFTRPRSPFYAGTWTREDLDEVLRHYHEQMDAAERARESDLARVRREAAERKLAKLAEAIDFLRRVDVHVYSDGRITLAGTYHAPDQLGREYVETTAEGVFELARARGWTG